MGDVQAYFSLINRAGPRPRMLSFDRRATLTCNLASKGPVMVYSAALVVVVFRAEFKRMITGEMDDRRLGRAVD